MYKGLDIFCIIWKVLGDNTLNYAKRSNSITTHLGDMASSKEQDRKAIE